MFDIIGKRKWFYSLSILFLTLGFIFLWKYDLKLSIDFEGGSMLELKTEKPVIATDVYKIMENLGYSDSIVQTVGTNNVIIRSKSKFFDQEKFKAEKQKQQPSSSIFTATATMIPTKKEKLKTEVSPVSTAVAFETDFSNLGIDNPAALTSTEKKQIIDKISETFGMIETVQMQAIGPTIGEELAQKTIWAVVIASLFIILYIAYAFRSVPAPASSWRFGICAVAALLHDTFFILGAAAFLGHFIGLRVDALFVVALLNIMSFSVHDSIVVLDRIRENLIKMAGQPFESIVNQSILQTIVRSLNINLTIIFTLTALYLFGAESIKNFVLILILGIAVGTFSSIFNVSPLLVTWHNWSSGKKSNKE